MLPALWTRGHRPHPRGRRRGTGSPLVKAWALGASDDFFGQGVEHPLGEGFAGAQDILPFALDEQTAASAVARIPDSVTRQVYLCGTPDEVVEQAAEWRDRGMRYIVVMNQSAVQLSMRKGLASLPFQKVLSGLKKL
jgi:phthiodiolone/phenolphthiodiolone dimycocerosates ketoreductase